MKLLIFILNKDEKGRSQAIFSLYLVYNNLIEEQESAHRTPICMISDIPCLHITNNIKVLEKKIRIPA